jgi:hypothetical protein
MPDRNSADFRLTRLLQMLRQLGDIWICVPGENRQADRIGVGAVLGYRQALQAAGVRVAEGGVLAALRERRYAAVIFEWHFPALAWLETVRLEQPQARVVIDSVDVVFHRLEAKARVSGLDADRERASSTRRAELEIYGKSDLVITVTDADAAILREELPATPTFTLPNIHPMHAPVAIDGDSVGRLLFIGSYARPGGETNIDAMRWFCGEILPLVLAEAPGVSLRIVGGPRIDEVSSLESPNVQVLGFVPETQPYLAGSGISIAPLRFGGGMKGKIGEAMSFGLPVVTTTTGVEGFGLTPGRHVLVGDSPRAFADHVLALIRDDALRDRIRLAGHAFIRDHYSDAAVARRVEDLVHRIEDLPSRRPSLLATTAHRARQTWRRHVGWRLGRR